MSSAVGAAQSQLVLLTVEGGVATLAFNRPQILNAMDADMMIQFRAAAELVERDPAVRVILLRGEGAAFLAGGDVALFHQRLRDLPDIIVRWGREMHFAIQALRRSPKPVLASVHGACAGAGFSILCAADLAVAADNARFSLAYANIGASPDGGSSFFLPRLVGYKKAMELTLLPDLFDAQTAKQHGLVNWVVPADQLAVETARIAKRLANGPTVAYGEAKQLMNRSLNASMETQMEEELFAFARCARTQDLAEGVTAFVEKRKAMFTGR
jgi:2-(1,2-epoxy-1,2-dihydrophenyl)acetyl-CoA isomerase